MSTDAYITCGNTQTLTCHRHIHMHMHGTVTEPYLFGIQLPFMRLFLMLHSPPTIWTKLWFFNFVLIPFSERTVFQFVSWQFVHYARTMPLCFSMECFFFKHNFTKAMACFKSDNPRFFYVLLKCFQSANARLFICVTETLLDCYSCTWDIAEPELSKECQLGDAIPVDNNYISSKNCLQCFKQEGWRAGEITRIVVSIYTGSQGLR